MSAGVNFSVKMVGLSRFYDKIKGSHAKMRDGCNKAMESRCFEAIIIRKYKGINDSGRLVIA